MKLKEFKKAFRSALYDQTPDLLDKIETSCKNEIQNTSDIKTQREKRHSNIFSSFYFNKWVKVALAFVLCLTMFSSGLWAGFAINKDKNGNEYYTQMYLDVNPGFQISFNKQNRVVDCLAINEDAQNILNELNLVGIEFNTAVSALVSAIYINGYLTTENNSILVSIDNPSQEHTQTILSDVTLQINNVFKNSELDCSIIAQSVTPTIHLKEQSDNYGVSVGKMQLINKMINGIDSLTEEDILDLANMNVSQLNFIYSQRIQGENDSVFNNDVISGNVGGFLKAEEALCFLLEEIKLQSSLLQDYHSYVEYEKVDGEVRLVYNLSIILFGELLSYHFKVDCITGEILQLDFNFDVPGL